MKIFLSILLVFSIHIFSDDHKKLDPIIFMLDLSVNDGRIKKAEKFTYDITKNVMKMEPDTVIERNQLRCVFIDTSRSKKQCKGGKEACFRPLNTYTIAGKSRKYNYCFLHCPKYKTQWAIVSNRAKDIFWMSTFSI